MSVRDLIIQAPHLSGAYHAEKRAIVSQIIWEHEMENKAFGRVAGESALDRIAFLFDFSCDRESVRDYCRELCHLNVLAHYAKEHGDADSGKKAMSIAAYLASEEPKYPEVSKVLTVAAAADGWWGE